MATSTTFMACGQTHILFISRTMHCPAPAQELLDEIVRPFPLLEHPTTSSGISQTDKYRNASLTVSGSSRRLAGLSTIGQQTCTGLNIEKSKTGNAILTNRPDCAVWRMMASRNPHLWLHLYFSWRPC
jgi:hypothetical protein